MIVHSDCRVLLRFCLDLVGIRLCSFNDLVVVCSITRRVVRIIGNNGKKCEEGVWLAMCSSILSVPSPLRLIYRGPATLWRSQSVVPNCVRCWFTLRKDCVTGCCVSSWQRRLSNIQARLRRVVFFALSAIANGWSSL